MIQLIPTKTRKHAHGQPVTIPIHPQLKAELEVVSSGKGEVVSDRINMIDKIGSVENGRVRGVYVNPTLADWYKNSKWRISHGLELIFKAAHIETSVKIEGRRTRTPEATFHSLRHTFVSLAANAGVPLPVVQSIVGHSSTAMTRHYYHENLDALRSAVASIPVIGERSGMGTGSADRINKIDRIKSDGAEKRGRSASVPTRLRRLDKYLAQGLITQDEHAVQRARILAEL